MKNLIAISIYFFSYQISIAHSELQMQNITLSSGMQTWTTNCLHQDSIGYIWIGTNRGLYRYNGKTVKEYSVQIGNENLNNFQVLKIIAGENNDFWVFTISIGFLRYNYDEDKLIVPEINKGKLSNIFNNTGYLDKSNNLWVAAWDCINSYNIKDKSITQFPYPNNKLGFVNGIYPYKNGTFLLSTRYKGIIIFNPKEKRYSSFLDTIILSKHVRDIYFDDYIYVSTWNEGIYIFDKDFKTLIKKNIVGYKNNSLSIKKFRQFYASPNKTLYIGSEDGLFEIDKKSLTVSNIKLNHRNEDYANNFKVISDIIFDKTGKLWVSYFFGGASYELDIQKYNIITSDILRLSNQAEVNISKIIEAGNYTFFAIGNSNVLLNLKTNERRYIHFENERNFSKVEVYKNYLVFAFQSSLNFYNYTTFKFEDKILLPSKDIINTIHINNDYIYIATANFIYSYSIIQKQFLSQIPFTEVDYETKKIRSDSAGNVFYFKNNIYQIDFEKKKINIIKSGHYKLLCFESKNKIFYRDSIDRLCLLNLENGQDTVLTSSFNKLYYPVAVCVDKNKNAWIISRRGLSSYNLNSKKILHLENNKIINSIILDNIAYAGNSGKVYLGGINGANWFYPDSFKQNNYIPKVYIDDILLFNETIQSKLYKRNISLLKKLELSYQENYLTFIFYTGSQHSDKTQYLCYLEGIDHEWISLGNTNKISYQALQPGKYKLFVKASNNQGEWNATATELEIIIKPPFWDTFLFKIIILLLVIAVIYAVFQYRTMQLRNYTFELERKVQERTQEISEKNIILEEHKHELEIQAATLYEINTLLENKSLQLEKKSEALDISNQELSKVIAAKDKFFSIIAHDLKNPFSGILSLSELIIAQYETIQHEKIKDFLNLINTSAKGAYLLLENLLSWAMTLTNRLSAKPDSLNLHSVTKRVISLLSLNASKKNIQLINDIPQHLFGFADFNMIETIIRNIINNAIKFSPENSKITIQATLENRLIQLMIIDEGVGMSAEKLSTIFSVGKQQSTDGTAGEKGTGLGLLICKEFALLNNGDLTVKSEIGVGTTFILQLPSADTPTNEILEGKSNVDTNNNIEQNKINLDIEDEKLLLTESIINIENHPFPKGFEILIVDDHEEIRKSLKEICSDAGVIYEAENGLEGYNKALEFIPDIIISDVMMPVMDGYELTKKLKENENTNHIPIILLTSRNTEKSRLTGLIKGADDYITKPFNSQLLRIKIKNILSILAIQNKKFLEEHLLNLKSYNISDAENEFIKKVASFIDKNIANPEFGVDELAENMKISRTNLYRKFALFSDESVNNFIKTLRLKKGAYFITTEGKTVSEAAFAVGFNDPKYFSKCFKQFFGKLPSEV